MNATISPVRPRILAYTMNPEELRARAEDLPGMQGVYISEFFPMPRFPSRRTRPNNFEL